ncbi:MAG: FAD-binding oxidoreductase [Gaiellaceae bacterium]
MTSTASMSPFASAVATLGGKFVLPDHARWDDARRAWNLTVDQRPTAVVLPESAEDVVAAVELAQAFGLRVAAQGTGHNAAPLGPLDDTILVKTERMRRIEIDPETRTARVDAGVRSLELVEAAARHGLSPLPGSSPDVGVVGYTLGGGVSWFGRKYGLASSNVCAIELVTAGGSLVRADREHEPELFWALPWRRRQLRHRHRDRAAARPRPRGLRGHPLVADRARPRGPARLGRADPQRTAGRADHRRALPPAPAAA